MKRKFLFEILDSINEAEDFKVELFKMMDSYKPFKQLIYMLYNGEYEWEANKAIANAKARSDRDNGGFASAWCDIVTVIENKLIKNTILSARFIDFYCKCCRSCNKNDVQILNYAVIHRNLPGFKGARKKIIVSAVKEYFGDGYKTI